MISKVKCPMKNIPLDIFGMYANIAIFLHTSPSLSRE
jgi:hypothetical protein